MNILAYLPKYWHLYHCLMMAMFDAFLLIQHFGKEKFHDLY
jgi:hypothetical protein